MNKKSEKEIEVDTGQSDKEESMIPEILVAGRLRLENILLADRELHLNGEINEESAFRLKNQIRGLDKLNGDRPIYIWIDSPGGFCLEGLSIIDTFRAVRSPIVTIVTGMAASMAAAISVCGDFRLMTKNAYWMAHPMRSGMSDYFEFMKDQMSFVTRLNDRLAKIWKENTKLNDVQIKKLINGELWLDANQCKKFKVIDKVYPSRKVVGIRNCDDAVENK